jgi:peptidoglycan/xylan/chitin deacetylase (PgdA/CDA1 family)
MPLANKGSKVASYPPLILMYHAVIRTPLKLFDCCFLDAAAFEAQLDYLKARFDVVPLARIPALLSDGARRPTVAITFDDGFMNNYEVAFPILRRADVPATIFLCTDLINTNGILWFCRLNQALAETCLTSFEWHGIRYDLTTMDARAATSARLQPELKRGTPGQLMEDIAAISLSLGEKSARSLEAESPYRMLTQAAIREMERSQLVEFGAHTRSHAILKRLSATERKDEIEGSINAVEKLTGRPCRLFAYPNGRRRDYDQECVDQLAAAGITIAVTTIEGVNDAQTSPLELKRIGVGGDLSFENFKALVQEYCFPSAAAGRLVSPWARWRRLCGAGRESQRKSRMG